MINLDGKNRNIIALAALALVVAAALVYYFVFYQDSGSETAATGADVTGPANFRKIDLDKINTDIFALDKFIKLKELPTGNIDTNKNKPGNSAPFSEK